MKPQPLAKTRTISKRRLITFTAALFLGALAIATAGSIALAQDGGLTLVNHDRDFVERKKGGDFVARPVFDRQLTAIHYGVRHAETGDWIAPMYRVHSSGDAVDQGWEYSWHYGFIPQQPDLNPDQAFLLVMAVSDGTDVHTFHAVIPIYHSNSLWDRVLAALEPGRWARAFAEWVVEGIYGALCGVIERASSADACGRA